MTMLRSALLLLLSLLLACLSNPGMPLPFLAWLALVPLFYALEYASRRTQNDFSRCVGRAVVGLVDRLVVAGGDSIYRLGARGWHYWFGR